MSDRRGERKGVNKGQDHPFGVDLKGAGEEAESPKRLTTHFFERLAEVAQSLADQTKKPKMRIALLAVAAAITAAIHGGAFK